MKAIQYTYQLAVTAVLGQLIRSTPEFKGKGRLVTHWINHRQRNTKRVRTLPGGETIDCDLSVPYECMVWLKREEQADLKQLQELLKSKQTFVDCGANVGIWTLTAASVLGLEGQVYAFEPSPKTFEKLAKNIETAKLKNIIHLF